MKAKGSPTASTQEAQQNPAANQQPAEEASSWSSAPAASGVTLSSVFAYSVAASVADEQMNAGLLRAEARWEAVWAVRRRVVGIWSSGGSWVVSPGASVLPVHTSGWSI